MAKNPYSRAVAILTAEGFQKPTAEEKKEIQKLWQRSPQRKQGKSKAAYVYDATTGKFVTRSKAASKSVKIARKRSEQQAREGARNIRAARRAANRAAVRERLEEDIKKRLESGEAFEFSSPQYDEKKGLEIKHHEFYNGSNEHSLQSDTQSKANDFEGVLIDTLANFGSLRMLYIDAGLAEDEAFGNALDYDSIFSRFKSITNEWNNFDDKINGSPEEQALRLYLYSAKSDLDEINDLIEEAIREGNKWIRSRQY